MPNHYESYLPVVLAALTVLVLGCLNPPALQVRDANGNPNGCPNYLWLALFALVVGALVCFLQCNMKKSAGVMNMGMM